MLNRMAKLTLIVMFLLTSVSLADDWPQFRGPNRDGKSAETGLMKKWPAGGPKLLWSVKEDLGKGYASLAIADGMVYTTGMIERQGWVFAFDLDGQLQWKQNYGPEWVRSYPGTRTTPTIEDDRLYLTSGMGAVTCYNAKTGEKIWTTDAKKDFQGQTVNWGWAESPLIIDDKVICTPGGKLATLVALDKMTGKVIWSSKEITEPPSYCSPILVRRGGNKIVVTQTAVSLVGVDAQNGKLLWQDKFSDYQGNRPTDINPPSQLYYDGAVYVTSGYDDGGALLELSPDGKRITRKWTDKTLDNHHGNVVVVDGYIYGSNWINNSKGDWICLDWKTGKVMYEHTWSSNNKGAVIYADGMLYCYNETTGELALVPADPQKFNIVSSFKIPQSNENIWWAHPAISDGRLYVRQGKDLFCYDIKEKAAGSEIEGNWIGSQPYGQPGTWYADISGNSFVFEGSNPDEWFVGTFKLNPNTNPKTGDFQITDCPMVEWIGLTSLGIYKTTGNTFTLAANQPGSGVRPTGFYADEMTLLFEFKKR